jgi:DNA-binding CsgD family transcriptional regulator
MVLPGAAELVDAFSAIPPGPLRDSIVHHARMLAENSGWRPPGPASMDAHTARVVGIYPPPAPALSSPFAEGLSSTSAEGQIVERAVRGEDPDTIAVDMGVSVALVKRLMAKARREGGLVFPGDGEKAKAAAKSRKGVRMNIDRFPVPPPPYWWEDPASPIWTNPSILPAFSEDAKGSLAAIGPLDRRTFSTMANAAARKGLTLQALIERRYEILRRSAEGQSPTEISLSMNITSYDVYGLLTRVGRGRIDVLMAEARDREKTPVEAADADDAVDVEPEPESPPSAAPEPARPNSSRPGDAAKQAAAEHWGFPTVARFEDMRLRVRDLRASGWHPIWISKEVGMSRAFVKATIQFWRRERGVSFPPAPYKVENRAVA